MVSDNLLVASINKDDIGAFKQFFEGFYPSVCVFVTKYLKDRDVANDLAQEAFIEFWKRKGKFDDIKAVKGYIYTVARNKCFNYLKTRDIRENILKEEISRNDLFYEYVLEEETYSIIHQAVNKLAPQTRNIVRLSLEGKKNQEIAEQLDISLNTVKTLKKSAYKELRIQLQDQVFILLLLSHFLN